MSCTCNEPFGIPCRMHHQYAFARIKEIDDERAALRARVAELEARVKEADIDIDAYEDRLQRAETKVAELEAQLAAVIGDDMAVPNRMLDALAAKLDRAAAADLAPKPLICGWCKKVITGAHSYANGTPFHVYVQDCYDAHAKDPIPSDVAKAFPGKSAHSPSVAPEAAHATSQVDSQVRSKSVLRREAVQRGEPVPGDGPGPTYLPGFQHPPAPPPEPKEVPGPVAPGGGGAAEPLYQWVPRPDLDAANARIAEAMDTIGKWERAAHEAADFIHRRTEERDAALASAAGMREALTHALIHFVGTAEHPPTHGAHPSGCPTVAEMRAALAAPPSPTKEPTK